MFDTIAPRYDLINRLMTFGLDQAWRRGTVAALALPAGRLVLDLACGTGDLSRLALRRGYRVVGTDLSAGMLGANGAATPAGRGGRQPPPLRRRRLRRPGLRLRPAQLHRPGRHAGRVGPGPAARAGAWPCSRSTPPPRRSGAPATTLWFTKAVPALGAALSDKEAYRYLPQSVAYLPPTPGPARHAARGRLLRRGDPPLAGGLSQMVVATRAGTP